MLLGLPFASKARILILLGKTDVDKSAAQTPGTSPFHVRDFICTDNQKTEINPLLVDVTKRLIWDVAMVKNNALHRCECDTPQCCNYSTRYTFLIHQQKAYIHVLVFIRIYIIG